MDSQLRWLRERADGLDRVIVAYVAPRAFDPDVHAVITAHGFTVDEASVASERRNTFEYPGFRALKTLAQSSDPDDLLYYCHSKGILQLAASKMGIFRLHTEVGLRADLGQFAADARLKKAGIFPSRPGFCWYNFFWIKAGYMADLPVAESDNRYDFEALIGGAANRDGYQEVLPLIGTIPFEETGIAAKPWYRPEETVSPTLTETYYRFASMA